MNGSKLSMRDNSHSAEEYRDWIINLLHKYGRDEFIALIVPYGEESLLKSALRYKSVLHIADYVSENKLLK